MLFNPGEFRVDKGKIDIIQFLPNLTSVKKFFSWACRFIPKIHQEIPQNSITLIQAAAIECVF